MRKMDLKNKGKNNQATSEYLEDDMVAASTDLTGLIPTPPADEAEAESYADIHKVPVPEIKPERTRRAEHEGK